MYFARIERISDTIKFGIHGILLFMLFWIDYCNAIKRSVALISLHWQSLRGLWCKSQNLHSKIGSINKIGCFQGHRNRYDIIDHGHKKKLLICIFSKTYKLMCLEGVLYWCKSPILTFLDYWRHKIVNSIDQGFRQQF